MALLVVGDEEFLMRRKNDKLTKRKQMINTIIHFFEDIFFTVGHDKEEKQKSVMC